MNKGKLIVFEGIDGAGKTTQIEILVKKLQKKGRNVVLTREPTDSLYGKELRKSLSGNPVRSEWEMASLFLADRIVHNVGESGISALLAQGIDVICDRYYYSSMAYQGASTDETWVMRMNLDCPAITRPDLCIFLDLTPEQSLARIEANRTTKEIYETKEKLETTRNQFHRVLSQLKERENIAVINAGGSIEDIAGQIETVVTAILS